VSTDLCPVHFSACRHPAYVPCRAHVVGVVPSPRLCRRPFTRTHQHRIEALSFLAEPVHAHSRTREVVHRRMSQSNAAGPFPVVFPFLVPGLVHAINFVPLPWSCRRRSARTHTHATEGPSPCFTYLWPYSTFRRAVAANPNAPAHVCPSSHRPQVRTFRPLRP
jgi:hypothetical protein